MTEDATRDRTAETTTAPAGEIDLAPYDRLERAGHAMAAVVEAGRKAAARGWVPATSGNFSARIGPDAMAVTRSGTDKGALAVADVLVVPIAAPFAKKTSAEAPLHAALYARDASIGAVFHVHAPSATLLSQRAAREGVLIMEDAELLKAFDGVGTHETRIAVPVLPNDQDTVRLAAAADAALDAAAARDAPRAPGYLIEGHGLYAWGPDAAAAWRHLEAFDFLFELALKRG